MRGALRTSRLHPAPPPRLMMLHWLTLARCGEGLWCRPPVGQGPSRRERAPLQDVSASARTRRREGARCLQALIRRRALSMLRPRAPIAWLPRARRGSQARQSEQHPSCIVPARRQPSLPRPRAAPACDERRVRDLVPSFSLVAAVPPRQRRHPSLHLHHRPCCRCARFERQVYWGQNPFRAFLPQPGAWLRRRRRGLPPPLARAPRCRPASSQSPCRLGTRRSLVVHPAPCSAPPRVFLAASEGGADLAMRSPYTCCHPGARLLPWGGLRRLCHARPRLRVQVLRNAV
jgi:hypothetical protein